MMGVEFQVLKVLESLLIILLCKKFNYWVRCLKLGLCPWLNPPPPALQNPSLRLDSSFFFFLLLLLLANGCSLMHRFFAPPHGGRGKLKIKNDGGIIYIYIYIMYSVTSPRRGDGNTPDKYSIYIKVASLPFFYHELSLWDNTFMYIYMSSHARFVWVGLMAHALKTVRMHRTI